MKQVILNLAWKSIRKIVIDKEEWFPDADLPEYAAFRKKQGAFTTLYDFSGGSKRLRGCIGLPYPEQSLLRAIVVSARNSATKDPRFASLQESELNDVKISVEVLGPVSEIEYSDPQDLYQKIELGVDGLIIKKGRQSGIFLPRVPVEQEWNTTEYVEHLFRKAFLSYDFKDVKFFRFNSTLYAEY